jgi:phasin family protein
MSQPQRPTQTPAAPDLFDLYRAGLRSASEMMKASLESAERLQNQQLVAIRTALDQQAKAVGELGQAKNLDELVAVQTRLAGAQIERAMGLWTGVWQSQMEQASALLRIPKP